jgi:hypothetical protein
MRAKVGELLCYSFSFIVIEHFVVGMVGRNETIKSASSYRMLLIPYKLLVGQSYGHKYMRTTEEYEIKTL